MQRAPPTVVLQQASTTPLHDQRRKKAFFAFDQIRALHAPRLWHAFPLADFGADVGQCAPQQWPIPERQALGPVEAAHATCPEE